MPVDVCPFPQRVCHFERRHSLPQAAPGAQQNLQLVEHRACLQSPSLIVLTELAKVRGWGQVAIGVARVPQMVVLSLKAFKATGRATFVSVHGAARQTGAGVRGADVIAVAEAARLPVIFAVVHGEVGCRHLDHGHVVITRPSHESVLSGCRDA